MKKLLSVSIIAIAIINPFVVQAAVVNFSNFSQAGDGFYYLGNQVIWEEFKFSSNGGPYGNQLGVWQDGSVNHPIGGNANTSLMEFYAGSTTTMVKIDNGAFQLNSIDLAAWGIAQTGPLRIQFIGTKSDNTTVSQEFFLGNPGGTTPVLQTFYFGSPFTDLVSVSFTQGAYIFDMAYQFNNINVSPVPIPAAAWLFGSALAGLQLFGKRRSSTKAGP